MRVLILGGGGNIGFWVEKLLIENLHDVYSIQRSVNKPKRKHLESQKNFVIILENVNNLSEMSCNFFNDFDLVIDFVCFNEMTAIKRMRLLSNFSGIFIMVSTVAVYDRSTTTNFLSSASKCENLYWEYARNKFKAEKIFLEGISSNQIKICRLGHTFDTILPVPFGTGDWTFVQWLLDGNSMLMHRRDESFWSLLHSRDAARRILLVATEPQDFANVVNIVNSQSTSWLEIGRVFFSSLRIPESFRFISVETLREIYPYWSESVFFHKQFDEVYDGDEIRKFSQIEATDWNLLDGLNFSLDFYRQKKTFRIVNQFDYDQFSLLAKYSKPLKA